MNLSIADGLKELLFKYHLSREDILKYSSGGLASLLEIDEYIARLILNAAKVQPLTVAI
jgi:hypothetical protein